jgi:hypothetical protein
MYQAYFKSLAFCLFSVFVFSQSSSRANAAGAPVVMGSGCVEPGVEAACLILHDLKTGENFNLFFKGTSPKLDTAIAFEGTVNSNPNICMQGKPIDVTEWHPIRLHCPQKTPTNKSVVSLAKAKPLCGEWAAWYNTQPGGPKALHVAGICTFPDSGYSAALTKHVPPGVNVKVYLLDLTITPPSGNVSHIIRHVPVHFTEQTDVQHDSAEILPDHVSVPVKIVH